MAADEATPKEQPAATADEAAATAEKVKQEEQPAPAAEKAKEEVQPAPTAEETKTNEQPAAPKPKGEEEMLVIEVPEASGTALVDVSAGGVSEVERLSGARLRLSEEAAVDGKKKLEVQGRPIEVQRARVLIEEKLRKPTTEGGEDVPMVPVDQFLPAITLAGHAFKDRDELLAHIRQLQSTVTDGAMLGPEDSFLIFHLATYHPQFIDKMSAPVVGFKYGPHEGFGGSKCFFVVRADGSEEGISISRCVEAAVPKTGSREKGDGRGLKRERDDGPQQAADEAPPANRPRREIQTGCVLIISGAIHEIPYDTIKETLAEFGDIRFVEFIRANFKAVVEEAEDEEGEAAEQAGAAADAAAVPAASAEAKPEAEAAKPAEEGATAATASDSKPMEVEAAKPAAEGNAKPAEGDAKIEPAKEGDAKPAEGDAKPAEGEASQPAAEGEKNKKADEGKKAEAAPRIQQVRARFGDAESAQKALAGLKDIEGQPVTVRLLEGDEEKEFWDRLFEAADRKGKGKGKGKKGKDGKGKGKDKGKGKKGKGKGKGK